MDQFLKNLIKKSGDYLLDNFRTDRELIKHRTTSKEAATQYDKILDRLIIEEIQKKYPDHSILTEESGFIKRLQPTRHILPHQRRGPLSDWLWIVDSLDGTSNFANSNPLFSVCIAVMHKNELILGTVYAPAIDEFYFAQKGKGAYFNQKRIKVSNISKLDQGYVVYCEGNEKNKKRIAKIINKIYPKITDLRKIGSAGIETAWVAAGRGEAYFTTKIDPWDVAAGILLIKEAGGKITDFKGNPWQPNRSDLLFSNKKVHSQMLNLIKNL